MEKEIDDLASSLVDKILQSYMTEANSSPLSSVGNYNDSDQEVKKSPSTGVLLPGRKRPVPQSQINSRDRSGRTLLHKYVANGDLDITESLLKAGASVQISDYAGWTPLHEACLAGHSEVVELLLGYDADVDAKGGDGDTPLHDAIGNGHVNVVLLLLKHGANLNLVNQHGENPEECAAATLEELKNELSERSSPNNNNNSSELKNAKEICEILKTWKQMIPKVVERNAEGQTLFHIASSEGDIDRVKSLLEYGSDINAVDNSGWTPAHNAALHGHDQVLAFLLRYGSAVDPIGMDGETPLHDAVANGHAKCVKILLQYGADVLKKNSSGKTPKDLARDDHEDVKRLVNFSPKHWEPFMQTEFYPRLLRDSSKIPEDIEESATTETIKEAPPISQNNSFSWGGLDPNAPGDFMSEREKKKFQALLKTLSQAERDALEGNKPARMSSPQQSLSKERDNNTTPRPRGRPPGAKNIKLAQKASSKERKGYEPNADNYSALKRPGSAVPVSEPKRPKSSMESKDLKQAKAEGKPELERPKPKEMIKLKPRPPKPQPAPISKLHIALAEMKEEDMKHHLKKKKRFAISGYQAADSSTEVSSESIVTDTSSIPVLLPEPVKVEVLPPTNLISIPVKKTLSESSTSNPVIIGSETTAEKEKKKTELETKHCLPLCAYIKPDEEHPYFKPSNVRRENMWGALPKVNHSKVFVDMQLAYCLGLQSGRELLEKYPKLKSRVATTHEKTALEGTVLSNRLLKTMLLTIDPLWIKTTNINGVECAMLGEIDIHIVSWNEELYRVLNLAVINLEKTLGAPIDWLQDLTWPAAPEDFKDPSLDQATAKVYVHKLKRHKPRAKVFSSNESDLIEMKDPIEEVSVDMVKTPRNTEQSMTLIDRYCPTHTKDLVVHKKKVEQVREWMKLDTNKPRILLLTGPVGSGKTAVIKCIANELDMELKEWSNEINTNSLNFEDTQYTSVLSDFADHVRSCIKSASLRFGEKGIQHSSNSLLLLEDLPNISNIGTREKVHSLLEEYISSREASCPIVIIISDLTAPNSNFASDIPITKRSFVPISVLQSPQFTEISFNPVAKSFIARILTNICQKERYVINSKALVEDISINCEGDIRKAINYLQFHGLKNNSVSELKKDELSIYNIIGKIIYNKREEFMADAELQLDGDNLKHQRKMLAFNPEDVLNSGHVSHSTFSLFVNQNYTSHVNTLEEVVQLSESLSLSDICAGHWNSEKTMENYAISIAARGVLFSWDPMLPRKSIGYKGFIKPEHWNSTKLKSDLVTNWQEDFFPSHLQSYCSKLEQYQASPDFMLSSVALKVAFEEIIPYLGLLNRSNYSIIKFMPSNERQYLFKINSYQFRSKLVSFYENEEWQEPIVDQLASRVAKESKLSSNMTKLQILQSTVLKEDDIEEV